MKSGFKFFAITWVVIVAVFNVIVFITPNKIAGISKFGGGFWVGYVFIMLTFFGLLGVAWYSLNGNDTKVFYHIPLFSICFCTLIMMMIVGSLCMVISKFPIWLGIILCILVLAFGVICALQAETTASLVGNMDQKIKGKTLFVRSLIVEMDSLLGRQMPSEIADEVKRVYEVLRYSDPMSNEALVGLETQITLKINDLVDGINQEDATQVKNVAKEVEILLIERNKKCKLLK